jgi:hypothetical protein
MIATLLLAAAIAGQNADEPVAKKADPVPPATAPLVDKPQPAAKKAARKVKDKSKAEAQDQSVLNARNARRAASNRRRAAREAQEAVDYQKPLRIIRPTSSKWARSGRRSTPIRFSKSATR